MHTLIHTSTKPYRLLLGIRGKSRDIPNHLLQCQAHNSVENVSVELNGICPVKILGDCCNANVCEDVDKRKTSYILECQLVNFHSHYRKQYGDSSKK
jgi:hypothetical protein